MSINNRTIQILGDQGDLQKLYSSSAKIIIAAEDKHLLQQTLNVDHKFDTYELEFEEQIAQGTIKSLNSELDDSSHLVQLQLVPNFCGYLLAFTAKGESKLSKFINWCSQRKKTNFLPKIIKLNPQQEPAKIQADFWQQMYQKTEQETQAVALRNATLQKQYLNLRNLHENMQNAFAAVEDYLSQAKLPELQLAFDNQPIQKLIQPGNITQSNSLTIKQLLPVSSRGLAVIDLRIANTDKDSVGDLIVQLKYCENNTSFAKWQIPYEQLPQGWLSLDLPNIDIGRKRDVELTIDWHTQAGTAPSLILGEIQLIPELRAYYNEQVVPYSLAFRIWQGLPGTRKVTSPHLESSNQNREIKLGFVGQGVFTGVQEITAQSGDNFAHVQLVENGSKIMTHPRVNGDATIATLPFSFSSKANYLTATVITEHPEADTMEYALAVVSKDKKLENTLPEELTLAHSGWIAVESNTPRQISVYLDNSPTENSHIVLAARLGENSKPDCAWCRWLNFKLDWRLQNPLDDALETLRNASVDAQQERFPRVQRLNEGKIQVHPFIGIDTVAVLANAVPQNTALVKAIVCTPNDKASAIEYAMAVIQHDDDTRARLAVTNPESALGFTGWHRVEANTPYRLNLELNQPTDTECHLVLTTRIPQDGIQAHAWARWIDINYIPVLRDSKMNPITSPL